jgi:selenide, water dikinase
MHEVVLVGGGHAHVEVIRRWGRRPPAGARLTVVVDEPIAVYSGMVPGFVGGRYGRDEIGIDVRALAEAAGARTIVRAARRLDPDARRLELADGESLGWDTVSLDVGASVLGLDRPGVREHALATRPIGRFTARVDAALAEARRRRRLRVVVVGGGAAGVELAFAFDARARREGVDDVRTTLVESGPRLLPGHPAAARRIARETATRGIGVCTGVEVARVAADHVELGAGGRLESDVVAWATGASGPALVAATGLPTGEDGFLRVRATLQCVGRDDVFAAGDCASLEGTTLPKAGVHAVREAPVLDANLRARVAGRRVRRYRPQRDVLVLLNLGDGRALGTKWGLAVTGRAVFRLKEWIDRRFVARYRVGK